MGYFKKDRSFKPTTRKQNKYALTRLQSVHGNLAYSENGFKYTIKHQQGEDRLYLIYSDNVTRGRNVSKLNDTLTLHLIIKGVRLQKAFERQGHYLYSDCPEVLEKLESEGIDGPKKILEFVEMHRNCDN